MTMRNQKMDWLHGKTLEWHYREYQLAGKLSHMNCAKLWKTLGILLPKPVHDGIAPHQKCAHKQAAPRHPAYRNAPFQ
jgi:hypothetical protein